MRMIRRRIRNTFLLTAAVCAVAFCAAWASDASAAEETPVLRVGHVGHDHHSALFVAADLGAEIADDGEPWLDMLEDRARYALRSGDETVCIVEIVRVGGGSKMPTALAQGVIDVGLGGVAAMLANRDKGGPVRIVAPLHQRGDMLAVSPKLPVTTWEEFVAHVRASKTPVRIGFKAPIAVAKVILEEALVHEKIPFSENPDDDAKVLLVNVKGGGKLNWALASGVVDAYAGNNPFPAVGESKGVARVVCDLEELPPGTFTDHPCCCVGANLTALREKRPLVVAFLKTLRRGTAFINAEPEQASAVVARWTGATAEVETKSMATSDYSMEPSDAWREQMAKWIAAMNRLDALTGELADTPEPKVAALAYDLTCLAESAPVE